MSDPAQREWRLYLDDMVDFAGKVLAYTDGIDQAGFVANEIIYDATLRNLELIGEAATHIPDAIRTAHPDIPWRMIVATRNRLIHGMTSGQSGQTNREQANEVMLSPDSARP